MNQEHVSLIQSFNDEFNPFGKDWIKLYPDLTLVDIEFRLFEMYKYDEENKQLVACLDANNLIIKQIKKE